MFREKINELKEWKESNFRKPLVLRGARQVGKTWLLKEFGNTFYDKLVYINFEEAITYHEKADSIVSVLDEVDSLELITELQKQYENEKLRSDNLQMKMHRTVFLFCGTIVFLIVAFYMCYY